MTTETTPDYYGTLGVQPDASPEDLKKAYRKRAMECHPDRGGSHAQMVEVLEAWEILSDSGKRAHYDSARINPADTQIQQVVREEARTAQSQAENYPRQWSEFEKWQQSIFGDFGRAKYSIFWFWFIPLPVVAEKNQSITAWLFSFSFAVVFLWFFSAPVFGFTRIIFNDQQGMVHWVLPPLFAFMIPAYFGFSAGTILHAIFSIVMYPFQNTAAGANPQAQSAPQAEQRVMPCLNCGQMLRFPVAGSSVKVTCPKCRSESIHNA